MVEMIKLERLQFETKLVNILRWEENGGTSWKLIIHSVTRKGKRNG